MEKMSSIEEKTVYSLPGRNKFSSFGYFGANKKYPVFVDDAKKIYVVAKSPKDFLHCVKRMNTECILEEMKDMFDFKMKYEKLCKTFEYDKKIANEYLQKSVDHMFGKYNQKTSDETVDEIEKQ